MSCEELHSCSGDYWMTEVSAPVLAHLSRELATVCVHIILYGGWSSLPIGAYSQGSDQTVRCLSRSAAGADAVSAASSWLAASCDKFLLL